MQKDGWQSRWVKSDWKRVEGKAGSFKHATGKWHGDPDDKGIFFLSLFLVSISLEILLNLVMKGIMFGKF